MFKNLSNHYGIISQMLHHITGLTVIGLFALGFWMVGLSYYDEWYKTGPYIHKSIGILLAGLFLFRLIWSICSTKPNEINPNKKLQNFATKLVHRLLYLGVFIIIFSGYFISTADGQPIKVFNWFTVPAYTQIFELFDIDNVEDIAGLVHEYTAYVIMAFVSLHALAALKHHFINKDATLTRMFTLYKK